MGDRGNIVVRQGDTIADDVWFYTHGRGYEIKHIAQSALKRKQRLNDPPYFARILFGELIRDHDPQGETGFGISTSIGDNSYPIVVVDLPRKRVVIVPVDSIKDYRLPLLDGFTEYPFEAFCALDFSGEA